MKKWSALAFVAVFGLISFVNAGGAVKSGPQAGEDVPGPFHPLNVNGKAAGKKHCLFCENSGAGNAVAVVFAREVTPAVSTLIKKLDEAAASKGFGSYAVFCSDSEKLEGQLKELSDKANLKKVVLSIDNPAGPKLYNISKDADVTVILYTPENVVQSNFAFRKGELKTEDVATIVNATAKIKK